MKQTRRDRQWASIRWVEFGFSVVMVVALSGLLAYASLRPASDLVFWLVSSVIMLAGLGIWVRQYQVLDELGRLRFLKSWLVSGMVTVTGLVWTMLWAAYQSVKLAGGTRTAGSLELPSDYIYVSLFAGFVAMGLTNLYLRRRDGH